MASSPAKVALVTGSGKRRVGNVVALALAARGYSIALHYNRSAEEAVQSVREVAELGVPVEAYQADVSSEAAVVEMFERIMGRFGRLDALVTTAAVWNPRPLEQVTAADIQR